MLLSRPIEDYMDIFDNYKKNRYLILFINKIFIFYKNCKYLLDEKYDTNNINN